MYKFLKPNFYVKGEEYKRHDNVGNLKREIKFCKQNKILIHQFIFNHYKNKTTNDPSSMAIFEKKLRSIANTIKDDFIKKYVLEYFLEKIAELTPHSNQNMKKFLEELKNKIYVIKIQNCWKKYMHNKYGINLGRSNG